MRILAVAAIMLAVSSFSGEVGAACVWKVTGPNGGTLYLGGSIHALRSTDYPLPAAYNRAFDASSRLVFENDPKVFSESHASLKKSGEYPTGDSLKNHIDPRSYDFLRRIFAIMKVPEEKFAKLRPWALIMTFSSPGMRGLSSDLGVEGFLNRRAKANAKSVSGLESFDESMATLSGMSDQQAEKVLLAAFIPHQNGGEQTLQSAWRRGDAEAVQRINRASLQEVPSFYERLVTNRNRNWVPKIEGYLRSGNVYFVVAGAAHMGGPDGVLALLKARSCQIEQL